MLTLKTLLIICPLVFLAGFVDAIAGGCRPTRPLPPIK